MTLRGNTLLKVGVPVVVLVMILIVVRSCSSGSSNQAASQSQSEDASRTLSREEMDALGISGDSPTDTVATLVGQMNAWERQRQRDQEQVNDLLEENRRLTQRAANVDQAVEEALQEERQRRDQQRVQDEQSLMDRFEQRMNRLLPDDNSSK